MTHPMPLPVEQLEERVAVFLASFRKASGTLDVDAQRECFAETFLVGDADGARPVPREVFLQTVPARAAAAKEAGVGRAQLIEASMLRLDDSWVSETHERLRRPERSTAGVPLPGSNRAAWTT
jgi:hypothetical protein